jgi:hypothetical protein
MAALREGAVSYERGTPVLRPSPPAYEDFRALLLSMQMRHMYDSHGPILIFFMQKSFRRSQLFPLRSQADIPLGRAT